MKLKFGLAWGATLGFAAGSIVPHLVRLRRSPKDKERRRRDLIEARGRVIEGYASSCKDGIVEYSYQWRGVRYDASQDIAEFLQHDFSGEDFSGAVTVKFLRDTPTNSILVSEKWSGIPWVHRSKTLR